LNRLLVTLGLLALPALASADCGSIEVLEAHASAGKLTAEESSCVELALATADPIDRVDLSFVLILQALMSGDDAAYVAHLERHLASVHTTDPEVAYLYATWLQKHRPERTADVLHWADVAFAGRGRWVKDLRNYTTIVRSVWDLRIEASMRAAMTAEQAYAASPTPAKQEAMERARRAARYYMIAATPCLHYGDCGPRYEVEVEGQTSCEDLDAVERALSAGPLHPDTLSCLKARWYRNPRQRLLDLLAASADRAPDSTEWEALLAWHFNATGEEDAALAQRYQAFLEEAGGTPAPREGAPPEPAPSEPAPPEP
jgi:hypothetical protein